MPATASSKTETLTRLLKDAKTKLNDLRAKDQAATQKFYKVEQAMARETEVYGYESERLSGEADAIKTLHDAGGCSDKERDEMMRSHRETVAKTNDDHNKAMQELQKERQGIMDLINRECRGAIRVAMGHEQFLGKRLRELGVNPDEVQGEPAKAVAAVPEASAEAKATEAASPAPEPVLTEKPAKPSKKAKKVAPTA